MKRFLPILTFLAGCVLGALVVWVLLPAGREAPGKVRGLVAIRASVVGLTPHPHSRGPEGMNMALTITLDKGQVNGVRKGMCFEIWREGQRVNCVEAIEVVKEQTSLGTVKWGARQATWKQEVKLGDVAVSKGPER